MVSKGLIDVTKKTWQPHYKEPMDDSFALEIVGNCFEFINVISDWVEKHEVHIVKSKVTNE
jgi:hypothetical protein